MAEIPKRPIPYVGYAGYDLVFGTMTIKELEHEHAVAKVAIEMLELISNGSYNNPVKGNESPNPERAKSLADEALRKIKASGWQP